MEWRDVTAPPAVVTAECLPAPENTGDCATDGPAGTVNPSLSNVLTAGQADVGPDRQGGNSTVIPVGKKPRRILHFSDGILEEYSTDEEDEADKSKAMAQINPKTLPWKSWLWYQTTAVGNISLKVCDYLGESLASFFGITSPKYQYEIDEYRRMMMEEEEAKKKEDMEMAGWREPAAM